MYDRFFFSSRRRHTRYWRDWSSDVCSSDLEGQLKLLGSKVLLLGAGGLGSPAALYLAAAGVGTIGIIDMDVVDASNLQRQILHNMDRIDRKSTRLNSSHANISYAVFCLKKKKKDTTNSIATSNFIHLTITTYC